MEVPTVPPSLRLSQNLVGRLDLKRGLFRCLPTVPETRQKGIHNERVVSSRCGTYTVQGTQ